MNNKDVKKLKGYREDMLTILSGTTFSEKGQYEKKLSWLLDVYLESAFIDGTRRYINSEHE